MNQPDNYQYWYLKCVEKAREDYYQRFHLELMSEDNNYFLFYDSFLESYGVWEMMDTTREAFRNILKVYYDKLIGKYINHPKLQNTIHK